MRPGKGLAFESRMMKQLDGAGDGLRNREAGLTGG